MSTELKQQRDLMNAAEEDSPHVDNKPESDADDVQSSGDNTIDPENEMKGIRLLILHSSICLVQFMAGLDFNLIATSVPVITAEFNSIEDVGWYGSAYMIALCASQPTAGKTFILFPKKLAYLAYLVIFLIGNLICALARSSTVLIVGRAVAGLGASGIFAGSFVVLTTVIPLHRRAVYLGSISAVFAVASIVGPPIGGALTEYVTWRWCFYIILPIGGLAAALFYLVAHFKPAPTEQPPVARKLKSLDGLGFVLFAGSIIMLLLALEWGGANNGYPWNSSVIIGLFVGFGVTFAVFIIWQLHLQDDAMIPPRLFKASRNVGLICAGSFFINGPFQIIIYWLPIWFQAAYGATPTQSGVNYLPTVISDVLASFIGAALVTKLGIWNPFLLLAPAFVSLAGGLLSTLYPSISHGKWIGYQIFGGIGYSLASNLAHLGMQASLPKDLVPLGASNLLAIISTSCAVFLALGQAIFQHQMKSNLASVVPSDVVNAVISAGATNIGSVVSPQYLPLVIAEYGKAATQVFYIPAAAPVISFILILACKWTSLKKTDGALDKDRKLPANEKA
ncbi:major facilitator superfamily domain-containing protein [Nemania sp. FL0031]|nr:major facilitator superfamily domain-containing protein [Nemania sp. FL0031]